MLSGQEKEYAMLKKFIALLLVITMLSSLSSYPSKAIPVETGLDIISLGADAAFCFSGSTADCAFMVVDVVALILPFVSAHVTKTMAKQVWDASKKGKKVFQVANKADNILQIAKNMDDLKEGKGIVVSTYSKIQSAFSSAQNAVEAHHLLEHRGGKLAQALGLSVNNMLSIPLFKGVHKVFTERWARELSRTGQYSGGAFDIIKYISATKRVYYDTPLLKKYALYQIYASPAFLEYLRKLSTVNSFARITNLFMKYGLRFERDDQNQAVCKEPNLKLTYNDMFNDPFLNPFAQRKDKYHYTDAEVLAKAQLKAASQFNVYDFETELNNILPADFLLDSEAVDITKDFAGKTVRLKSVESGKHIVVKDGLLWADAPLVHSTAEFNAVYTADGWLGLQYNGKWLGVKDGYFLKPDSDSLQSWECFKVFRKGDYHYLLSQRNRSFVQAKRNSWESPLAALRPATDGLEGATWERFWVEDVSPIQGRVADDDTDSSNAYQQAATNQTTYVTNQYYYKTEYIQGYYTGEWKNAAPNGNGTLVYSTNSAFYNLGARSFSGSFIDGASHGWGKREYTDCYYEGNWYGMYQPGKIVFDGTVVYTSGQNAGWSFVGKIRATSYVDGSWTQDSNWQWLGN